MMDTVPFRLVLLLSITLLFPDFVAADSSSFSLNQPLQHAIRLSDNKHHYDINQKIRYFEDDSLRLGIDEVSQPGFSAQMKKVERGILNLEFTDSAIWIKTPVIYIGDQDQATFWFEVQAPLIDHTQFYIVSSDGRITTQYAGYETGTKARTVSSAVPIFSFTLEKGESLTLYTRLQTQSSLHTPFNIYTNEGLVKSLTTTEFIYSAVYGALLIMVIYNLLLFLGIREKAYGYYVLFLFTYFFGLMIERVNGVQGFGSESLLNLSRSILLTQTQLAYVFGFAMARAFIGTKELWPALDRVIRIFIYAGISSAAVAAFLPAKVTFNWMIICTIFYTPMLLFIGLYAIKRGVNGGTVFLVSWICNFGGITIFALAIGGTLPFNAFTWNGHIAGLLLQTTFLSFALGDRMKDARRRAIEAKKAQLLHLAKYKKLFNNALEGVFQLSPDRLIIEANPALVKMLGFWSLNDLKNRQSDFLDLCLINKEHKNEIRETINNQEDIWQYETQYKTCQGDLRWVALSMRWVNSADKPDYAYIEGSFVDITDHIAKEQAEKERYNDRLQKKAAESSALAKSQFLANMSHEIRTPLTAIIGYGESIQDDSLTKEERTKSVETIVRSGHHLLELINDIIDHSKIDENKLDIEISQTSLLSLIEEIKSYFAPKIDEKGLNFEVNYHFPLPEQINTDPTRLKQILINLCGNALKFTEKGGITIDVSCHRESEKITIKVRDTGIGLKPDQISRLFNAYEQADTSTTREYGGTGLGLNISKKLAELLGGTIRVSSVYGDGSEFEVTIGSGLLSSIKFIADGSDLGKTMQLMHFGKPPRLRGAILYAEDNEINRRLITMLVEKTGASITTVEDGAEAVKAVMSNTYDLILMDIQMPVMDGVEATKTIRKSGNKTPIVALTANIMAEDIHEYKAVGCEDCLAKPVDKKKFYATLSHYLLAAEDQASLPRFEGNILIADDHLDNQLLMKRYLNKVGLNVLIAENGKQAVEMALKNPVDIVFMDLHMPEMSGEEAIKTLLAKNFDKPIYAFTASEYDEDIKRLEEAGSDGLLIKPVNRPTLYRLLEKHLPVKAVVEDQNPEDAASLEPIRKDFLKELPERLLQLENALQKNNWSTVSNMAIKLKGIATLLGYNDLCNNIESLETTIDRRDTSAYFNTTQLIIDEINLILNTAVDSVTR